MEQTLGPGLHASDISLCDEMGEGLFPLEFFLAQAEYTHEPLNTTLANVNNIL